MSQANVEVPPVAPAAAGAVVPAPAVATATPAAAPVAPAAAPAPAVSPAVASADLPPVPEGAQNWLTPRLKQAEASGVAKALKKLGVKDEAEAEALLKKARDADEATKSELQKAQERAKSLEVQAARAVDLEKTVKARADVELAALTDAQRAAVAAVAGDDPARTLATIDALKPTWVVAAPAAVAVTPTEPVAPVTTPAKPAPVAPATTSPPPNAPNGSPNMSPPNRKAEYDALKTPGSPKYNPHAASLYLNKYADEIYPRA